MWDRPGGLPTEDENKNPSSGLIDYSRLSLEEGSYRWYAYHLREYSIDWEERHPRDVLKDTKLPISKASRFVHNLRLKLKNSEKSKEIDSIIQNCGKTLSKLVDLEDTLPTIKPDSVEKLYEIVSYLNSLADSIEGLEG